MYVLVYLKARIHYLEGLLATHAKHKMTYAQVIQLYISTAMSPPVRFRPLPSAKCCYVETAYKTKNQINRKLFFNANYSTHEVEPTMTYEIHVVCLV